MNWTYDVAGDANVVIRRLSIELQEAVYDELENLAENGDDLRWDEPVEYVAEAVVGDAVESAGLLVNASSVTHVLTLLEVVEEDEA